MNKAYPKYKPSGVEWLGDVPEHWGVKKIRHIFTFRSGGTPSTENVEYWDGSIPWVSSKDMKSFYIEDTEDHINEIAVQESATNLIPAHTLVVVMRSGILIHSIPACVLMSEMAINQDIKAFFPLLKVSAVFYARFIQGFQKQLLTEWRKEGATVESLDMELVKNFPIIFPPLPEQQAIAAFLDRETGRIDALIAKKQRLLELLAEQRTALISRAVTKGLSGIVSRGDAEFAERKKPVKYKPSGVEWLGDVPEHWEVKKIRHIFTFRSGGTPSTENVEYWDGSIPWVSSKDMKSFYIEDTEDHINEIAVQESATNLIPAHTLVVVMRSGILIHSIPACVLMSEMAINQDIKAFFPLLKVSAVFYARFIQGFQKQLLTEWRKEGATVESLDMELVKNFPIIFPPLPEQQAIAAFLDRETARIDTLSAKVTTVIERLKEYRTALISSAVTGKIDVRSAL